ncbi:MAG: M23 family metallopeptidase [Alphaproteobacteria bacterium]|nr:M23 family metallopeptidase [Alphaproteobacteria bacterium]MBV9693748.1 M23 family metallopeptidase [Alphaproteobacteria bacterium]
MIDRRIFVSGLGGFALAAPALCASEMRLSFAGSLKQGSLVIGHAPGATVRVDGTVVTVSPGGTFAFGLRFDRTNAVHVSASFADGSSESRDVMPAARQYEMQTVNGLPENTVSPPPEILARIARENARIAEARNRDSALQFFAAPFDWPVKGIVSGLYGSRRIDNGKPMAPHFGVDIAAPKGTPIRAPADGIVSLAEPDFYLTGGTTLLDHGHGVSTVYIHQDSLRIKAGDAVKRGDVIGFVGMKGRATGPHLHWGLDWFSMPLDPALSAATPLPEKG